jgi:hypothetical protein
VYEQNLSVMGVASCRRTFLCLMLRVRLVPSRFLVRDWILFDSRACRRFRSAEWLGPTQPGPARPWCPTPPMRPLLSSLSHLDFPRSNLSSPSLSPRGALGFGVEIAGVGSPEVSFPLPFLSLSLSPSPPLLLPLRALPCPCRARPCGPRPGRARPRRAAPVPAPASRPRAAPWPARSLPPAAALRRPGVPAPGLGPAPASRALPRARSAPASPFSPRWPPRVRRALLGPAPAAPCPRRPGVLAPSAGGSAPAHRALAPRPCPGDCTLVARPGGRARSRAPPSAAPLPRRLASRVPHGSRAEGTRNVLSRVRP